MADWPAYSPTRINTIGLSRITPRLWRFVSLDWEGGGTSPGAPSAVGPYYRTKAEALADLTDYAAAAGWEGR